MARVLVLEDDELLLMDLCFEIEDMGHEVVVCRTGSAAFDALANADPPFDLLVSDIYIHRNGVPIQDGGIRLLGRLQLARVRSPDLPLSRMPVLTISGAPSRKGQSDILRMASRLGSSETLEKPFGMAQFCTMVSHLLGVPNARAVLPKTA